MKQTGELQQKVQELLSQVVWLNRQLFGRKSEKPASLDPNRLALFDTLVNPRQEETDLVETGVGTGTCKPVSYTHLIHTVHAKIHTWIRLFPYKRSLQSIEPSSFTLLGWFRLSSIDQYSSLLPPVGVWTVSQFQCGGPSSQNPYPSKTRWAVTPPTI